MSLLREHFGDFGEEFNAAKHRKALRAFYAQPFWKECIRVFRKLRLLSR